MEEKYSFSFLCDNIYLLKVPFLDIFTSVFLVLSEEGVLIFDTASSADDVDGIVIPALEDLGISREEVTHIVISHTHGDHIGGLARMMESCPGAVAVTANQAVALKYGARGMKVDGAERLLGTLQTVIIPGHTVDCLGIIDTRVGALISGDALQLFGVFGSGAWGTNVNYPKEYVRAIESLSRRGLLAIFTSHDFHPYGQIFRGESVGTALSSSVAAIQYIKTLIEDNPGLDDTEIAERFSKGGDLPRITAHVVSAHRRVFVN